jgi:hypothetical protein
MQDIKNGEMGKDANGTELQDIKVKWERCKRN